MDVQIRKIAWGAPKNIIAYHSTKIGGWSNGAFKFSNMSLDVGDNPKDVKKNRDSMIKQLNLNTKPIFMKQIHSATVRVAKSSTDNLVCDSCYTSVKGLPLAVLSADCLPILISSNDGNKIWSVLERNSEAYKAGIGHSKIIDGTGKFEKLIGMQGRKERI